MTAVTPLPSSLSDLLNRVDDLARGPIADEAPGVDADNRWPEAGLRALQAAGLGGLVVPVERGGLGHGILGLIRVCERIGQSCASTALCFGMHCVGAAVLAAKATPQQQEQFLDPINRGEHLTTLALSEPQTGAHFYFPMTRLEHLADDTYRVSGAKSFVTNGGRADSYVVSTVAADPQAPPGEFSCVVLPHDTEGIVWGRPWAGFGMRGNTSRSAELRDVVVPRDYLLGEEGDQIWYIFHVVAPYFLAAMAGTYLGIATAALAEAQAHLQQRQHDHSGKRLGQHPVLQHRLGTLWSTVERTRRLVYFAGQEADAGGPDALPALCSAKAEVADAAVHVTNEAMTLMGGRAYSQDGKLGRLLRDARAAHVMAPTTDILRTWTGRMLLGLPLLGE